MKDEFKKDPDIVIAGLDYKFTDFDGKVRKSEILFGAIDPSLFDNRRIVEKMIDTNLHKAFRSFFTNYNEISKKGHENPDNKNFPKHIREIPNPKIWSHIDLILKGILTDPVVAFLLPNDLKEIEIEKDALQNLWDTVDILNRNSETNPMIRPEERCEPEPFSRWGLSKGLSITTIFEKAFQYAHKREMAIAWNRAISRSNKPPRRRTSEGHYYSKLHRLFPDLEWINLPIPKS